MKLKYGLVAAFVGAIYLVVLEFLPDFPVSPEVILALALYALVKLGVEIVEGPAVSLFKKMFK